jgi:uncharacterized protein (TIGR02147 family)
MVDAFSALRRDDPSYSFRAFARMAGSTSPNYLQLIRDRKLCIQPEAIGLLASSLRLKRNEEDYLATLVAFDHAKTHDEKDRYFRRILNNREYRVIKRLTKDQFDYFSHWYMPVVRELVIHPLYPDAPAWIAKRIVPTVTEAKVRKAIGLLDKLGLISRDAKVDRWIQTDRVVSTPAEVLSLAVTRYHRDMIGIAQQAVERFPSAQRDIRSVTLGLDTAGYREVKKRLQAFWKELLAFSSTQKAVETVYQINTQLFPLTRKERKRR